MGCSSEHKISFQTSEKLALIEREVQPPQTLLSLWEQRKHRDLTLGEQAAFKGFLQEQSDKCDQAAEEIRKLNGTERSEDLERLARSYERAASIYRALPNGPEPLPKLAGSDWVAKP